MKPWFCWAYLSFRLHLDKSTNLITTFNLSMYIVHYNSVHCVCCSDFFTQAWYQGTSGEWLDSQQLQWRHNERYGVSNHQPQDCLLNRVFKVQIKENIKAPRHWPLCREFTGDRWIPRTKGQWRGKCFHLMTSSWYTVRATFCHNLLNHNITTNWWPRFVA